VSFNDFVAFANFGPIVEVTTDAFVKHFRAASQCADPFFRLFESSLFAFLNDIVFAAIQAAIGEFAGGFQNVFRGQNHVIWIAIAFIQEIFQWLSQRGAFGLAFLVRGLFNFNQASNFVFEFIAAS
jgi:hypothetical protein